MRIEQLTEGLAQATGSDITTRAAWWRDDVRLVGDFAEQHAGQAWKLLAFGLEYRKRFGLDQLQLVVPQDAAAPTVSRAAWLQVPVQVFVRHDDGRVEPVDPPRRGAVTEWFEGLGPVRLRPSRTPPEGWPDWLYDLADWTESRRVERFRSGTEQSPGYWSWLYRGRQVLKVVGAQALTLTAGKDHGEPTGDQIPSTKVDVAAGQRPSDDEVASLRAAIDVAIERRRRGLDDGHRESLLQAAIGVDPGLVGMTHVEREFPAWRPHGEGSIDFLGVDDDGRLHVIETKIGAGDEQLGVQGLDYWGWTTAHRDELTAGLGRQLDMRLDPTLSVELRYVLAINDSGLLHRAALATIEALDRSEIPWRIQVIRDWNTLQRPGRLLTPDTEWVGRVHELPPADVLPT